MEPINFKQIQQMFFKEIEDKYSKEYTSAEIRQIAKQMSFYVEQGMPYGEGVEHFLKWYQERGGRLHEKN